MLFLVIELARQTIRLGEQTRGRETRQQVCYRVATLLLFDCTFIHACSSLNEVASSVCVTQAQNRTPLPANDIELRCPRTISVHVSILKD